MADTDPLYERVLDGIAAFSAKFYAEADPDSEALPADEDTAPLFDALARIEQRYKGAELIGQGGMKEIYRVHDRRASRDVAMARPAPRLDREDFDAFLREAHLTARLDHPGIIKLFDMGIGDDARPFFTMEFKKGLSLRKMIRSASDGKPFPMPHRLAIFLRVGEAVAYAHSRRVLHLDLKPENVQVGEFGEVQVCDWGMGVVMTTPQSEANHSEILLDPDLYGPLLVHSRGTPDYMAPEQFNPRQPKTSAMDIHALGCLLQELVTLQGPQDAGALDRIPEPALQAIVSRARHQAPDARYRSVEDLTLDVSRYMTGYSTSAENAGFLREFLLFYRRNRTPCRLAAGLLMTIVVLTAVFIVRLQWHREQARSAQQTAERAQVLYLAQKIEAETALENYRAASTESDRRLERHAQFTEESASRLTNPPFLDEAVIQRSVARMLEELDLVIALDPPPESAAWHQKFWLLFLTQDFARALAIQGKDMTLVEDLIPLAKESAAAAGRRRFLTPGDFGSLLAALANTEGTYGNRLPLIERMLVYDLRFPRKMEDRVAIVREVLAAINPESHDLSLDFDPTRRALAVQGSGVRFLSLPPSFGDSQLSLLRVVDPLELSLRGIPLRDLEELKGLRLIELDLRDSQVDNLLALRDMRSLKRLLISPGQFTSDQLSVLPEWVEVAEE